MFPNQKSALAPADDTLRFDHYVRNAQMAEQGLFDRSSSPTASACGKRTFLAPRSGHEIVGMEPMTLLSALAVVTKFIGLVITAATTYNEPDDIAGKFTTLDLISEGRAGWNIVPGRTPRRRT